MKITGSQSLSYFGLNRREPKDIDRVFFEGETIFKGKSEDDTILPFDLYTLLRTDDSYTFVIPEHILSLKMSHLAWDIHWEKTKNDILWLKAKGVVYDPLVYSRFKTHWEKVHGDKKFLTLNKNKEDFFNDFVKYDYDHDYLHELVAFPNAPVYSRCLKDGEEILIDQNKFDLLCFEDKVKMFREEVAVIAAERWYLKGHATWFESYMLSLKKTITRLTKNWACDFIITNLEHFVKPEFSYFENLTKTLRANDMTDKTIFHEIAQNLNCSVDELVYSMCEGCGIEEAVEVPEITYPMGGDRAKIQKYWEKRKKLVSEKIKNSGIEEYKHLQQEGGGEGGAEYCFGIFKLNGKIYRAEYSYYSHHGHEYDDIINTVREVKPVQKTITVYE